jgi:hypothetical protein
MRETSVVILDLFTPLASIHRFRMMNYYPQLTKSNRDLCVTTRALPWASLSKPFRLKNLGNRRRQVALHVGRATINPEPTATANLDPAVGSALKDSLGFAVLPPRWVGRQSAVGVASGLNDQDR